MISGIIKVEVCVIMLTETLIISHITKTGKCIIVTNTVYFRLEPCAYFTVLECDFGLGIAFGTYF